MYNQSIVCTVSTNSRMTDAPLEERLGYSIIPNGVASTWGLFQTAAVCVRTQ